MKYVFILLTLASIALVPFLYIKFFMNKRVTKEEEENFNKLKEQYAELSDSDKEKVARYLSKDRD